MDEVISEQGELTLFGLFLREDSPDKWDLVIAGPWIEKDEQEALQYLAQKVSTQLASSELLSLSRIVILDKGNPALEAILKTVRPGRGIAEFNGFNLFGLPVRHAYLFRATRLQGK